jgi:hypothetical protein
MFAEGRHMKILLLSLLSFLAATLSGQDTIAEYYKTGAISALTIKSHCNQPYCIGRIEEDVLVFAKDGALVYRGHRRNYAGHSSVALSYHSNGGVHIIRASSAPDAGIQWYRATIKLDTNGKVLERNEMSHEDLMRPSFIIQKSDSVVKPQVPVKTQPFKQEVVKCATIVISRPYIINKTKSRIYAGFQKKYLTSETLALKILRPGDTLQGPDITGAELFIDPATQYTLTYRIKRKGGTRLLQLKQLPQRQVIIHPQQRMWYYYWID